MFLAPGVLGNDSDADNDPITVADPRTNAPTSQGGSVTLYEQRLLLLYAGGRIHRRLILSPIRPRMVLIHRIPQRSRLRLMPSAPAPPRAATPTPHRSAPTLTLTASRVSGVLYNDFGGTPPLTAAAGERYLRTVR